MSKITGIFIGFFVDGFDEQFQAYVYFYLTSISNKSWQHEYNFLETPRIKPGAPRWEEKFYLCAFVLCNFLVWLRFGNFFSIKRGWLLINFPLSCFLFSISAAAEKRIHLLQSISSDELCCLAVGSGSGSGSGSKMKLALNKTGSFKPKFKQ